jgi:hypothetical protein
LYDFFIWIKEYSFMIFCLTIKKLTLYCSIITFQASEIQKNVLVYF